MGFYKQVVSIAIIILIVSLAIIGTVLVTSADNSLYPPSIAACPDFYKKIDTGECQAMKPMYDPNVADCETIDFTTDEYLVQGSGPNSGACAKKEKANECQITWDGITNNSDICYG